MNKHPPISSDEAKELVQQFLQRGGRIQTIATRQQGTALPKTDKNGKRVRSFNFGKQRDEIFCCAHNPRKKYTTQKHGAMERGIPFLLTFEQWWDIWQVSGKWQQRGRCKGQYVMSRPGDIGAYEKGNVQIILASDNIGSQEWSLERRNKMALTCSRRKQTATTCKKISEANKGRPKTLEWRINQRTSLLQYYTTQKGQAQIAVMNKKRLAKRKAAKLAEAAAIDANLKWRIYPDGCVSFR